MVKEGHISLDNLNIEFGYSTTPNSLHLYNEEENAFRQDVREFALDRVAPLAEQIEQENRSELVLDIIKEMSDRGYLSFPFPKELEGAGKGLVYRTIFNEELNAAIYAVSFVQIGSVDLFGLPVLNFGSQRQIFRELGYLSNVLAYYSMLES